MDKSHEDKLISKHMDPLTTVPTVVGKVPLYQPAKKPPQWFIPGDVSGIVVPPVPTNRIQEPPLLALNSDPLSQVPYSPVWATFRVGSLIVVYDVQGAPLWLPILTLLTIAVIVTVDTETWKIFSLVYIDQKIEKSIYMNFDYYFLSLFPMNFFELW